LKSPEEIDIEQRKSVGKVIADIRRSKNLSQEALSELANCHRNNIGFIERGERSASMFNLHMIASALETSASEVLKEAGY